MRRRAVWAMALLSVGTALLMAPGAQAYTANMCQLNAALTFSKPLQSSAAATEYKLSGRLESCSGNQTGGPTAGTIEGGQILTIDGHQYREPVLSGTASCTPLGLSQFNGGNLIVRWDGGGTTILTNAFAGTSPLLDNAGGAVVPSLLLAPVDPDDDPYVLTTSTYPTAWQSLGVAALQYPAPTDCASGGVTSATMSGVFGMYSTTT